MDNNRKNIIYGNCEVYSPDDQLMFLCLEKKANWYIRETNAQIISYKPLRIRLTFEPGGYGNRNDEYSLSLKENICVICGEDNIEILTKHHIVPIEYRKHFPLKIKSRSSHDIVVLCKKHHHEYENNFAQKLKREFERFYDIPHPKLSLDRLKTNGAYALAMLLLNSERCAKIPKIRIEEMNEKIREVFGHNDLFEITKQSICKSVDEENLAVGKLLVEKIENIEGFIKIWRQHFVHNMCPQHMPKGWNVNYPITVK